MRDYDPGLGRYVQSDPVGIDGGINTYSYANSNPTYLFDSYGLSPECNNDFDRCMRQYYQNNYGRLYDVAQSFNPIALSSLAAGAGAYTVYSLSESKIIRNHYTYSSSRHQVALRQASALKALGKINNA